jgi:predicted GNAT superfamily acetyltransferase
MNKEFIPYEQALDLEELGFDEPCFAIYCFKELRIGIFSNLSSAYNTILAPLYQQAFRWFREKYQIDSWIYPNLNGLYSVSNIRRGVGLGKVSEYQTYEEAELACLIKLIEIVKNK